jgi:hypothetical protein
MTKGDSSKTADTGFLWSAVAKLRELKSKAENADQGRPETGSYWGQLPTTSFES